MKHMGLASQPPFNAHMPYVCSWNTPFSGDGGKGMSRAHPSNEDDK